MGCAVAAGHPDRGGWGGAAGCALGAVLPAGERDARNGLAGWPLRADAVLCGPRVLGCRHVGIPGVAIAAPRTREADGRVSRTHSGSGTATGATARLQRSYVPLGI